MDGHGAMGKPGLRSGRNLFLRLGGRLSRPGWRLQLRGPGRWSIDLRDRGRGAGAKHDIKHAAPNWIFVALGGRRRWWCWCAWLRHGRVLGQLPSIAPLGGQGSPPRGTSTLLRSAGAVLSSTQEGRESHAITNPLSRLSPRRHIRPATRPRPAIFVPSGCRFG